MGTLQTAALRGWRSGQTGSRYSVTLGVRWADLDEGRCRFRSALRRVAFVRECHGALLAQQECRRESEHARKSARKNDATQRQATHASSNMTTVIRVHPLVHLIYNT
jgi:hypothetical protein